MDWKIPDAKRVLREKKAKHTRLWRDEEKVLRELGVRDRFIMIWESEKERAKVFLKKKKDRKVEFIIGRMKEERRKDEQKESSDTIRNIYYGE